MPTEQKVCIITSSVEAGTVETMPVTPEMELIPHEKLEASDRIFEPEQKICITSEYSLSKVFGRLDTSRQSAVEMLKDKFRFREILSEIYPGYGFQSVKPEDIRKLSVSRKSVIKPTRGIFGTAVRIITPETDFGLLSRELRQEIEKNATVYPDSVLTPGNFIVEDFIEGEEYAVDMFYDSSGNPQIVNIMHHPLPGNRAYLHMLYNSSKSCFDLIYGKAKQFFEKLNHVLKVKNFVMHSELKLHAGEICPVEINCMRFGGMGLCNLVFYSHGINPFMCFLNDLEPDWDTLWTDKEKAVFSYLIAYNGIHTDVLHARPMPDRLKKRFTKVLKEQLFDFRKQLVFGIYFLEETEDTIQELLKLEFDEFFEPV